MPIHTSLNRGAAWLLAFGCALSVGCSDETGIMVEVTRDVATTSDAVDELRFFIGTRAGGAVFVQDVDPLEIVALPGGRDLAVDPYRLLLRDGGEGVDEDVMVAVIGYVGGEIDGFGAFDTARRFEPGKVLKWSVSLEGRGDVPVTDTGCLVFDGGKIAPADDQDCDGDRAPADCNDRDPEIGPSAQELCGNGIDDNCNMVTDEELDADDDGFTNCEECDDGNELVNPDAQETCDGIDNDCDGSCDVEFDEDGDDYTTCGSKLLEEGAKCLEPTADTVDCDDTRGDVFPDAEEVCDGADNDCNELCDEGFDPDLDNFTECGSIIDACDGMHEDAVDCEPEDGEIHPGAIELCNGADDNCDGRPFPETTPCYGMDKTEGGIDVCVVGTRGCDDSPDGAGWGDCLTEGRADDEAFRAPPALCEAYDACDAAEVADPFACAGGEAAAASVACTLHVGGDGDGLCPNRVVPVPVADKVGCAWTVLGGKAQRHYEVGLSPFESADIPPDGAGTANVLGCAVWFQVVKALGLPPAHDRVLLWHRDAGNPLGVLIDVQLTPVPAAICPEIGLECAAFPDLGPGG